MGSWSRRAAGCCSSPVTFVSSDWSLRPDRPDHNLTARTENASDFRGERLSLGEAFGQVMRVDHVNQGVRERQALIETRLLERNARGCCCMLRRRGNTLLRDVNTDEACFGLAVSGGEKAEIFALATNGRRASIPVLYRAVLAREFDAFSH